MLQDQTVLRIPGPSPIPPSVQRAMSQPMIGHRGQETSEMLKNIAPGLKQFLVRHKKLRLLQEVEQLDWKLQLSMSLNLAMK